MTKRNIFKLLIAVGIAEFAGVIGSVFTTPSIRSGWYAGLAKPELAPPNWVFAPVWTTLFVLMGVSLFLVWHQHPNILKSVGMLRIWRAGVGLFFLQLVLNVFWSVIFFGLRLPGLAFFEIIFLWLLILATMVAFAKISRLAAWLLLPYLLWVGFAGYLNYFIWTLN